MVDLNNLAVNALKFYEDEECNVALMLQNDGEEIYKEIAKWFVPEYVDSDFSHVKITHTDNAQNFDEFIQFYSELNSLQPIKTIENFSLYDVDGIKYATEYCEGGAYAIYWVAR